MALLDDLELLNEYEFGDDQIHLLYMHGSHYEEAVHWLNEKKKGENDPENDRQSETDPNSTGATRNGGASSDTNDSANSVNSSDSSNSMFYSNIFCLSGDNTPDPPFHIPPLFFPSSENFLNFFPRSENFLNFSLRTPSPLFFQK